MTKLNNSVVASPDRAARRLAEFCEQVAADGILPSREWFTETANTIRELLAAADAGGGEVRPKCKGCEQGLSVLMLDEDGTLTSVSGRLGRPSHAIDDGWWLCVASASLQELADEIEATQQRIPVCAMCDEPIYDNGDLRCVDCLNDSTASLPERPDK